MKKYIIYNLEDQIPFGKYKNYKFKSLKRKYLYGLYINKIVQPCDEIRIDFLKLVMQDYEGYPTDVETDKMYEWAFGD